MDFYKIIKKKQQHLVTRSVGVSDGVTSLAAHVMVARIVAHPRLSDRYVRAPHASLQQTLVVSVDTAVRRGRGSTTVHALTVLTPL